MRNLLPILMAALLTGCAGGRPAERQAAIPASRILVMPIAQPNPSPEGAVLVRHLVQRWLATRGYVAVPIALADREIQRLPPDTAGPLSADRLQALAQATGADALAMIDLMEFAAVNRGFSQDRRVAVAMRLIDPADGRVLWQGSDQVAHESSTLNPVTAVVNFVKGIGTKALESALQSPLFPEADEAVRQLLEDLPRYRPA